MAIRAFLSFVVEDISLVNFFRGQAKNENNDIEFDDYSVKEPINSRNEDYIKSEITNKIKLSTMTICLYGPTTYLSEWVNWELNKTLEMGKPIMGVWLYTDGKIKYFPAPLANWPRVEWNANKIVQAMRTLAGGRY
jgi:hypothetical protein